MDQATQERIYLSRGSDIASSLVSLGTSRIPRVKPFLVSLDIETTGLDPSRHTIRVAAASSLDGTVCFLGAEAELLAELEKWISELPANALLVSWNGEEFDLPFLKARFEANSLSTKLRLFPRGKKGKYGRGLFKGVWGKTKHLDIAPLYRRVALDLGIRWSLKPVAEAVLRFKPLQIDRRGESIARADMNLLVRYVTSDATITMRLADRALSHPKSAPLVGETQITPDPSDIVQMKV
jgi:DNA polymerase elongation subunit (family B)